MVDIKRQTYIMMIQNQVNCLLWKTPQCLTCIVLKVDELAVLSSEGLPLSDDHSGHHLVVYICSRVDEIVSWYKNIDIDDMNR